MALTTELELPPGFTPIGLRESGDAYAKAIELAPEKGAATLVWTRRFDVVEIGLVLEPEEPLRTARRALYAGMNAAGDALATHSPPEKPIEFAWPDTIMFDGGLVGGTRLAWPQRAAEDAPPAWLVLGLMLRTVVVGAPPDATPRFEGTSLEAEGFQMLDAAALIGSFTRHLMVYIDRWQESGFAPVATDYIARLIPERGVRHIIDGSGDLLLHQASNPGRPERRSLKKVLAETCGWLDPETGQPWL